MVWVPHWYILVFKNFQVENVLSEAHSTQGHEATTTMHVIHFFILFFIGKIKGIVNHGPGQDLWLGDLPAELLFHIAQLSACARSSRPEVFSSKDDLENFAKFTGKHLAQSLFFNRFTGLRPAIFLTQLFQLTASASATGHYRHNEEVKIESKL